MKTLERRQTEFNHGFAVVVGFVVAAKFSFLPGIAAGVALALFAKNRKEGMSFSESARIATIAMLIGSLSRLPVRFSGI